MYECKFQYIAAAAVAENQHFMGKIIGNRINPTSLERSIMVYSFQYNCW